MIDAKKLLPPSLREDFWEQFIEVFQDEYELYYNQVDAIISIA